MTDKPAVFTGGSQFNEISPSPIPGWPRVGASAGIPGDCWALSAEYSPAPAVFTAATLTETGTPLVRFGIVTVVSCDSPSSYITKFPLPTLSRSL